MDGVRDWSARFNGILGSNDLTFRGLEVDLGEMLNGESMKCFILNQGCAHDSNPIHIMEGYRRDAGLCKANLSSDCNSLVRMHLEFFQMSSDCSLPDGIEICNDLLSLDAGLSFHLMQNLEQDFHAGRATLIVVVTDSVESDKVLRPSVSFVCLVSKSAAQDAPLGVVKSEKLHCTTLIFFEFTYDGKTGLVF